MSVPTCSAAARAPARPVLVQTSAAPPALLLGFALPSESDLVAASGLLAGAAG